MNGETSNRDTLYDDHYGKVNKRSLGKFEKSLRWSVVVNITITLAIPLYALFELGILLSWLAERKKKAKTV